MLAIFRISEIAKTVINNKFSGSQITNSLTDVTEKSDANLGGSSSINTSVDTTELPVFPDIVKPRKIKKKIPESIWKVIMSKIWSSSSEGKY